MYALLSGVVAALACIAGLAFLRSYARTRDRFFAYFAAAFISFGVTQIVLGVTNTPELNHPASYVPRLITTVLILMAIWDKNRNVRIRPHVDAPTEIDTYQQRRRATR